MIASFTWGLWSVFVLLCPQQYSWGRNSPAGDWMGPWEERVPGEHCAAIVWWLISANKCASSLCPEDRHIASLLIKEMTLPSKAFLTQIALLPNSKTYFARDGDNSRRYSIFYVFLSLDHSWVVSSHIYRVKRYTWQFSYQHIQMWLF